jgi:hypothetical protein
MTSYLFLKLLHLVAFVYWLGGDLGTFFSSRFVVDPKLSPAQRAIALKIMLGCDQGPKLCMPLIFAIGFTMAAQMSFITVPALAVTAVWAVALLWFGNVNYLYFTKNAAAKARLSQVDLYFRVVVVLALLAGGAFVAPGWLAAKIWIFAGLVACGIYIRIQLKPFVAGSSPAVEAALGGSIARVRPAVYLIWVGLLLEAALGLHLL